MKNTHDTEDDNAIWIDPAFGSRLQRDVERAQHEERVRRHGDHTTPDAGFGKLASDTPMSLRNRLTEMLDGGSAEIRQALNEAGIDTGGKITLHTGNGGEVIVEIVQREGRWLAHVPIKTATGTEQWRTFSAPSRDSLLASIMRAVNAGPKIRPLTDTEELQVARLCSAGNLHEALRLYLTARCGVVDEGVLEQPAYREVCNECAFDLFRFSTVDYVDSREARHFLASHIGNRPWSLPLLQAAHAGYKAAKASGQTTQQERPEITDEDLSQLSDEEIADLHAGVVKSQATAQHKLNSRLSGRAR